MFRTNTLAHTMAWIAIRTPSCCAVCCLTSCSMRRWRRVWPLVAVAYEHCGKIPFEMPIHLEEHPMRLSVSIDHPTWAWVMVVGLVVLVLARPVHAQPVDIPATWGGDFWSRPRSEERRVGKECR